MNRDPRTTEALLLYICLEKTNLTINLSLIVVRFPWLTTRPALMSATVCHRHNNKSVFDVEVMLRFDEKIAIFRFSYF